MRIQPIVCLDQVHTRLTHRCGFSYTSPSWWNMVMTGTQKKKVEPCCRKLAWWPPMIRADVSWNGIHWFWFRGFGIGQRSWNDGAMKVSRLACNLASTRPLRKIRVGILSVSYDSSFCQDEYHQCLSGKQIQPAYGYILGYYPVLVVPTAMEHMRCTL